MKAVGELSLQRLGDESRRVAQGGGDPLTAPPPDWRAPRRSARKEGSEKSVADSK